MIFLTNFEYLAIEEGFEPFDLTKLFLYSLCTLIGQHRLELNKSNKLWTSEHQNDSHSLLHLIKLLTSDGYAMTKVAYWFISTVGADHGVVFMGLVVF